MRRESPSKLEWEEVGEITAVEIFMFQTLLI